MKRRYKALIAIVVPVVIMAILSKVHPISYDYIMGYMVAVVLVFKSSIFSLWLVSKLKILHFLKSLTIFQAILLGIKRWLIDNIVSQWIEKHIISHFKKPFNELFQYYRAISFRTKVKNFLVIVLPLGIGVWIIYITDLLTHLALFVELKIIIIGFFKALWVILSKIFIWLTSSWFAPILEVFALSYLLTLFERFLGKNNPISKFFDFVGNKLNDFLTFLGVLNDKHIEPILKKNISQRSENFSSRISQMIRNKKIKDEYLYFDNFQNLILKGHINAYHYVEGMDKMTNKKELYDIINEKTDDNIDIIAYVSRNGKGELLEEEIPDDFYHDIFLLKGIASNRTHGVKIQNEDKIDYTDFWVLNSSSYPVWIKSHAESLNNEELAANSVKLIKTKNHINLESNDLYFEYKDKKVKPVVL